MLKTYEGTPNPDGAGPCKVTVAEDTGTPKPLPKRLDLFNHSPDGFAWGYGGSGPAQLALAILCEHLGDDEKAVALHQPFKWALIAPMNGDMPWAIDSDEIENWIGEHDGKA